MKKIKKITLKILVLLVLPFVLTGVYYAFVNIGILFSSIVDKLGGSPAPDFLPRALVGALGLIVIGVTFLLCWGLWGLAGIILEWLNDWYQTFKGKYQRRQSRVRHERAQREANEARREERREMERLRAAEQRDRDREVINYSEDAGLRRHIREFVERRNPYARGMNATEFDEYLSDYLDNRRNLQAIRDHVLAYLRDGYASREDIEEEVDEDSAYLERIGLNEPRERADEARRRRRRGGRGGGGITVVG